MTSGRRPIAFPKILGTTWSMLGHNSGKHPPELPTLSFGLGALRRFRQTHHAGGKSNPVQNQGPMLKARRDHQSRFPGPLAVLQPPACLWRASWSVGTQPLIATRFPGATHVQSLSDGGLHLVFGATLGTAPQIEQELRAQEIMGMRSPPPAHGGNLSAFMAARWRSKWRRGGVFQIPQKLPRRLQTTRRRPPRTRARVPDPRSSGPNPPTRFGRHRWGLAPAARPRPDPTTLGTSDWSGAVPKSFRAGPDHPLPLGRPSGWPTSTAGFSRAQRFPRFGAASAAQIGRQLEGIQTKPHQHRIAEQIVGIERSIQKMASATPARDGVRRSDVERLRDHRVPKFRKQLCLRELWRRFDSKPLPRRSS